jgi:hypothetical protein
VVLYRGIDVGSISHRNRMLCLGQGATFYYIPLLILSILALVYYCKFFIYLFYLYVCFDYTISIQHTASK